MPDHTTRDGLSPDVHAFATLAINPASAVPAILRPGLPARGVCFSGAGQDRRQYAVRDVTTQEVHRCSKGNRRPKSTR